MADTLEFTVSTWAASSVFSTYTAAGAGNKVWAATAGNRWIGTGSTGWLRMDLGTAQVAEWYGLSGSSQGASQDIRSWTFEGSNNASDWTVLDTQSGHTWSTRTKFFSFTNVTAYRYYRFNISLGGTGGSYTSTQEALVGGGRPPSRIWNWQTGFSSQSSNVNLGLVFRASQPGRITHFCLPQLAGSVIMRIYDDTGAVLATETASWAGPAHYYDHPLATPLVIEADRYYMLGHQHATTAIYFTGDDTVEETYGDIIVPANSTYTYNGNGITSRSGVLNAWPNNTGFAAKVGAGLIFQRNDAVSVLRRGWGTTLN